MDTLTPTTTPTISPTTSPTVAPTVSPTTSPTISPTKSPTTASPTDAPSTLTPTAAPTYQCQDCGAVHAQLVKLGGDWDTHKMCELLAELRSGSTSDACDDVCQNEVTTLYRLTNCVHTPCTDCAAVHTTVQAWQGSQTEVGAQFDGATDMCETLFTLRDQQYQRYTEASQSVAEDYKCDDLNTCKTETDYLLTQYFDECFLSDQPCFTDSSGNDDKFSCPYKTRECLCPSTTIQNDATLKPNVGLRTWNMFKGGSRSDPANFETWHSCSPGTKGDPEYITNCPIAGVHEP